MRALFFAGSLLVLGACGESSGQGEQLDGGGPHLGDFGSARFPDGALPDMGPSNFHQDARVDFSDAEIEGLADAAMSLRDASTLQDSGTTTVRVDAGFHDAGFSDSAGLDASIQVDGGPPSYALHIGHTAYIDYAPPPPLALNLSGAQNRYTSIQMPFAFEIFGREIPIGSPIHVTSNGCIRVGTATANPSNMALQTMSSSAPEMIIAGLWDDLDIVDDVYALAGPDEVRILWSGARLIEAPSSRISFQVRLIKTSNIIEIRVFENTRTSSGSATLGIFESVSGRAIELPCSPRCRLNDFYPGTVLTFSPRAQPVFGADFIVQTASLARVSGYRNENVTIDFALTNQGNIQGHPSALMQVLFSQDARWVVPTLASSQASLAVPAPQPGQFLASQINANLSLSPGQYHVALWTNDNWYSELNVGNNLRWLGQFEILPYIGQITILGGTLPDGHVGQAYDYQFQQTGAPTPTWRPIQPLPSGLVLTAQGRLQGVPQARTPFDGVEIGIEAMQQAYAPARQSFTLRIF